MWNIYSALAQSTTGCPHTLPALKRNLICASSASDTPWKPVPTLAWAQHKLHVSLLCVYSYFKARRSCPLSLYKKKKKEKMRCAWAPLPLVLRIYLEFLFILQELYRKKSSEIDFTPSSTSLDFTDVPPKIKMTSVFVHFVFISANPCILFASLLSILFCLSHTNTCRITVRHADWQHTYRKACSLQSALLNSCSICSHNLASAHSPHDWPS